jgi:dienelactone hydrolase
LGGVNLYTVDLSTLNPTAQPGFATKFRIYLPAKQQAPGSLACVLVAPAGTTLLHGSDIDSGDYHDETLPYARAGMAVIHYSLDGPMADMQSFTSEQKLMQAMNNAYSQFRAADAGVTNGRIALEFALAKLPQVDPARIFCAGHSSAGTLALQLAVEESRIAKCAAYAPATNLELRLMELLAEPALVPVFPDLPSFLGRYSPYSNASRISCPVFLFHARDDSNEPWSTTNDYASQLKRLRKNATFVSVDRGDHYQPMISSGIPKAIEWFQQPTIANQ